MSVPGHHVKANGAPPFAKINYPEDAVLRLACMATCPWLLAELDGQRAHPSELAGNRFLRH